MVVNKQLQKQIILEIGALVILLASIVYAIFAINNNGDQVLNEDGMVMVLDDASFKALESLSDGEGLNGDGIKYTVTNNNDVEASYKLILKVNEDDAILESLRVGADDLFIDDLLNLAKYEDGYIVSNYTLKPGFTKIHTVKMWYKLDVDHTIAVDTIDYSLELVRE
jgi:hypothetical protein